MKILGDVLAFIFCFVILSAALIPVTGYIFTLLHHEAIIFILGFVCGPILALLIMIIVAFRRRKRPSGGAKASPLPVEQSYTENVLDEVNKNIRERRANI